MKKVLITTGLALSLGLTNLGYNNNIFAETPGTSQMGIYQTFIQTPEKWNGFWKLIDNGTMTNMFSLASTGTTKFKVTDTTKEPLTIDTSRLDNSKGTSFAESSSPIKSHSEINSLTVSAGLEVTLGYEISTSAGATGLASMTSKLSGGLKVSAGLQDLKSTTTTITYGGALMKANPGEIVGYDYIVNKTRSSGVMNTGRKITKIGSDVWFMDIYNYTNGSADFNKYEPGIKQTSEEIYNTFKHLKSLSDNNHDLGVVWSKAPEPKYPAILPAGKFDEYFFIDEETKNVYTVENKRDFSSISGTDFVAIPIKIDSSTGTKTTDPTKPELRNFPQTTK